MIKRIAIMNEKDHFDNYVPLKMCENDKHFMESIINANKLIYKRLYKLVIYEKSNNVITFDIAHKNCRECPNMFCYTHDEFKTLNLCAYVVNQNGYLLSEVPVDKRTYTVCMIALRCVLRAMENIPIEIIDQEMVDFVFRSINDKNSNHVSKLTCYQFNEEILSKIPLKFMSVDKYMILIKESGHFLRYVPLKYQTFKIIKCALTDNYGNIDYIHPSQMTLEVEQLVTKIENILSEK